MTMFMYDCDCEYDWVYDWSMTVSMAVSMTGMYVYRILKRG